MNCVGLLLTYNVFISCLSPINHQPIWVSYLQPFEPNPCNGSKNFKRDNKNELKSSDYTNSGYDRGHLCPNDDYGCETYYMSNVVPMTPNFNRGKWKIAEKYIRDKYKGYTIYKGCDYGDIWKDKLQIPVSCWYKVFKGNVLIEEKNILMDPLITTSELNLLDAIKVTFSVIFFLALNTLIWYCLYINSKV